MTFLRESEKEGARMGRSEMERPERAKAREEALSLEAGLEGSVAGGAKESLDC